MPQTAERATLVLASGGRWLWYIANRKIIIRPNIVLHRLKLFNRSSRIMQVAAMMLREPLAVRPKFAVGFRSDMILLDLWRARSILPLLN
jgi:hypothetical protein